MPTKRPNHPSFGPLAKEEFADLVTAPFGKAVEVIRDFDPQFGRAPGEKFRWKVTGRRTDQVCAYVMAADQKEADKLADELADELTDAAFDNDGWGDIEIYSVEPDKNRR